jgi:hypothetical protein
VLSPSIAQAVRFSEECVTSKQFVKRRNRGDNSKSEESAHESGGRLGLKKIGKGEAGECKDERREAGDCASNTQVILE